MCCWPPDITIIRTLWPCGKPFDDIFWLALSERCHRLSALEPGRPHEHHCHSRIRKLRKRLGRRRPGAEFETPSKPHGICLTLQSRCPWKLIIMLTRKYPLVMLQCIPGKMENKSRDVKLPKHKTGFSLLLAGVFSGLSIPAVKATGLWIFWLYLAWMKIILESIKREGEHSMKFYLAPKWRRMDIYI